MSKIFTFDGAEGSIAFKTLVNIIIFIMIEFCKCSLNDFVLNRLAQNLLTNKSKSTRKHTSLRCHTRQALLENRKV